MSTEEVYQDAEIEGLSERSWLGSWARGVLVGLVVFVVGAIALSLSTPLPDHLPGVGKVEIVQNGAATPKTATGQPAPEAEPKTATAPQPAEQPAADKDTAASQPETASEDQVTTAAAPSQPATTEDAEASPSAPSQPETTTPEQPAQPEATAQDETPAADNQDQQAAATDPELTAATQPEAPAAPETPAASETPATPEAPEAADAAEPSEQDEQLAALDPEEQQPTPAPAPEINLPGPALDVNARPFSPPDGATLLAVVLQDADNGAISADALQLMTMPLTLAVGPGANSRAFAEVARASGHEILAKIPMAEGEDPPDGTLSKGQPAEQLTGEAKRLMAELDLAIGATAPHQAPLLRDADGMAAIMDPLSPHGFVWVDPRLGIGSAAKGIAARQDVIWSAGDRYVDPGASEAQVYQNLESSAALARRQGTSIVFMTASQDALKALVRWGLNRGGRQVWFAPISAVIKRRQAN